MRAQVKKLASDPNRVLPNESPVDVDLVAKLEKQIHAMKIEISSLKEEKDSHLEQYFANQNQNSALNNYQELLDLKNENEKERAQTKHLESQLKAANE